MLFYVFRLKALGVVLSLDGRWEWDWVRRGGSVGALLCCLLFGVDLITNLPKLR